MILELMPKELRIHLATANLEGVYIYVNREKENALGKISKPVKLKITYPLGNPAVIEIPDFHKMTRGGGITGLLQFIIQSYKNIYEEEKKSLSEVSIPSHNGKERGPRILITEEISSPYRIWGHSLEDLVLWGVEINTETGEITLGVDS